MADMTINNERFFTVKQAAQESGLTYGAIYSACKEGRIGCRNVNNTYMIGETALRTYIDHRRKRITTTNESELTIDDLAEELLKRIQDAYDRGKADGRKEAREEFMSAFKSVGK